MVFFIGAGPGDPKLITLKGKELLEKADIIIYAGSLVNPELLRYAKQGCEIYNSAEMILEEVIEVIKNGNDTGKEVVRLHTGDPSVYGAIREQMDFLDKFKIDYEVVPGVSSFCGAAAALKKEYTLPNVSQTVILTRMAGRTSVPERENIRNLASHKSTMVIFLSSHMIEDLVEELIEGYESENVPAAVVYKATWEEQKIVRGTLKDIAQKTEQAGINKIAIITVGYFLGDDYELSKLYDRNFAHAFRGTK